LSATAGNHPGLDRPASEADLLRAYAFGTCLAQGYEKTPFAEDAERTADLYMQGRKLGGDVYDRMRKAIPSDLAKPTPYEGHSYAIMKCLPARRGTDNRRPPRRGRRTSMG
jgi:hypothetical protein